MASESKPTMIRHSSSIPTVILTALITASAGAQSTPTRNTALRASRTPRRYIVAAAHAATSPVIDGRLDEPAWSAAPVAAEFVQQRPTPGAAATERTEARVLYDDQAIYVGMRMYSSHPERLA